MQPAKPSGLVKPTVNTKFHIDYSWWNKTDEDLRVYMLSHLPQEQRERLSQGNQSAENRMVDYIDPATGEVFQLDELGLAIQNAAKDPNFINPQMSLVDIIFRAFLSNNNTPLSPRELEEITGKPASVILKTISSGRVYKGIRPAQI
jgi:hypothetical protein